VPELLNRQPNLDKTNMTDFAYRQQHKKNTSMEHLDVKRGMRYGSTGEAENYVQNHLSKASHLTNETPKRK
jgi:hypothetical protein